MRIEEARAIAAAWVGTVGGEPPVVGAFCTGSTVAADPASELGPWSDVDLVLVVEGEAPAKLGKLRFRGVLLDVSYLPWSVLADHEVVARTFYLAPSFATDTVLSDPDGRLRRLADQVGRLVARPDVVRDRYEDVLSRLVAAPRPAASWAAAVTGWLFPASLSTNVVLVAAGRNPTVRLRYLRAREVLTAAGMPEVYQRLLERLGCAETTRAQVAAQLLPLTTAFEAAAARGRTDFPFAADITEAARSAALGGTAALVEEGEHREAVFWLVATFARCVQVLRSTADPAATEHEVAFARTVSDLLGVTTSADLQRRRAAVVADLPLLRRTADVLIAREQGRDNVQV